MTDKTRPLVNLQKAATGILGFDAITDGGLPRGRPTLLAGAAGSGKTLFGLEFLVRGIKQYNENGVFISFEERVVDLAQNVAALGYDLTTFIADKQLAIDSVQINRDVVIETGEFNLDGLFIRLAAAIDAVGAKRVVLDTIEALFAALTNTHILRAELSRLFLWLKDRGITAIITGERGEGTLTRHGLEEYVSDCVISLDQRVNDQIATRRLRIVKYRGSAHGTNEYPFLIDENGITVLPITSINLNYTATREFVATGIGKLDNMFGGKGYFRGGSLLVSGSAGTGKSSMAAHFADAACHRGEQCTYFAFEESPEQIMRNMRSIGLDLRPWVDKGLLQFAAFRPSSFGLEVHLSTMLKIINNSNPEIVVVDPISSFISAGTESDAKAMLMRLIDLLKTRSITLLMTNLTTSGHPVGQSDLDISSLIDSWVLLRSTEQAGERIRTLSIVKSRGMKHSNQARELVISDEGVNLAEVFLGPNGDILTGSARVAQEAADCATAIAASNETSRKESALRRRRMSVESRIAEMKADLEAEEGEVALSIKVVTSTASNLVVARTMQALDREQAGEQGGRRGT
jgi:circadian clock protein KaiC